LVKFYLYDKVLPKWESFTEVVNCSAKPVSNRFQTGYQPECKLTSVKFYRSGKFLCHSGNLLLPPFNRKSSIGIKLRFATNAMHWWKRIRYDKNPQLFKIPKMGGLLM